MSRLDKYRKYVVYSSAIGLVIGAILGCIFGIITKQRLSADTLYGAFIGTGAGMGFRDYYLKKHQDKSNNEINKEI